MKATQMPAFSLRFFRFSDRFVFFFRSSTLTESLAQAMYSEAFQDQAPF